MRDPNKAVEKLRKRAQNSEQITKEDSDALIRFSDRLWLLKSEYGGFRHEKLLRECIRMAEQVGGLADALENRESAESIVRWIHREYDNQETNRDYRTALRMFGKRVTPTEELPESLAWIPTGYNRNYDPKPRPEEMLKWEEVVLPMIEATMNSRDAALIAIAFDSGARSGELQALTVGDVSDSKYGPKITFDGKTGTRTVTMFVAGPWLSRWLAEHPASDENDAPLWCKLQSPEKVSYQMFSRIFKTAAERAGVDKNVTATVFRKSSASFLASDGLNQANIENRLGWKCGSRVASRYVSVFSEDADRELAKLHGIETEEDSTDPIVPVNCTRCTQKTPRSEDFCVWCGKALRPGAVEKIKERERSVRSEILDLVRNDPSILSEVDRINGLITLVEECPDLLNDAERFVAALDSPS